MSSRLEWIVSIVAFFESCSLFYFYFLFFTSETVDVPRKVNGNVVVPRFRLYRTTRKPIAHSSRPAPSNPPTTPPIRAPLEPPLLPLLSLDEVAADGSTMDRLIHLDSGHLPQSDIVPRTQTWSDEQLGEHVAAQFVGIQFPVDAS